STAEDKLFCNSPVEENIYNKYSDGFLSDKHHQNIDLQLPSEAISTTPSGYKREKLRSSSRQNLTSLSRDFKTPDTPSGYILPPLPQNSIPETKCNSIPRPTHVSRIPGQERFNKGVTKNMRIDSYQPQPKHSSSLPSIVEGPKSLKYKGTMTSGNLSLNSTESQGAYSPACSSDIKKISDQKLNNSEYSVNNPSLINKNAQSPECKSELKALQNICDGDECTKNNKIISSQHKDTQSSKTMNSTVSSQSRSLKPGKQSLIPKSSSGSKQGKDNGSASVIESTDKEDGTVQKRRISRFLRPDFFDTPPEESTYVKEREAKKAAEAEIKKAKRLARRTSSMRETSNNKTDIHDKNNSNIPERSMSLSKNDNKTGNTFHKSSEIHLANMENHNEKIKPNPKISKNPLSHSDDKCNKNQTWNSSQKGDVLRTSGSGLCASAKSRVGKAISSLQEHNFTPWDKKIVATESTYLKRAVSVDDVSLKSQSSLIKTNPKLGRKISSVLGLFSKMDNPALENQYLSNTSQVQNDGEIAKSYCDQIHSQNEVKTSVPSSNSSEKGKNKVEEKKQPFGSNFSIGEAENGIKNMKQPKSLKDSKNKVDLKKNNKKVAAQVISDALCITKDPSKKTLNSNPPDFKSTIASTEKIQAHKGNASHEQDVNKDFLPSNSSRLPAHTDESSNISKYITDNKLSGPKISSVDNENCEQLSLLVYKESSLPETNDSKYFSKVPSINSENSPADETESVDSWCASSDIDAQENLGLPGDDDDKESESVEDRIRRKSFYSRFNDVKKKGRKKSSQFLKDCRTTLLPTNYHKNDNQAFLPQGSNTGAVSKKLPVPSHTTETHKDLEDTNNLSISSQQNSMPESNNTNEVCSLEGKEISFEKNRILDNVSNAANENTSNTRALLRPAAFAQSVLKKTPSVKGKMQTQHQDGSTLIPKLSNPVSGSH
ncbi:Uncharacterized protein GBIM_16358, partial [Gryllus bimaculatus]